MQFCDIDFVIIGAGKSATTWLQTQLQSDPAVYMPDPEPHYFSREYNRGQEWYLSHFNEDAADKTVGEKSNSYLYEDKAAERLHHHLPHAKLIAQLRNPVERAYSNYCMLFRRGAVGSDLESYLDPSRNQNNRLLVSGNFASHLQTYIDLFGEDRLLILFFEGVMNDPDTQISRVRDHLGLGPHPLAPSGRDKVKDKTTRIVPPKLRKSVAWLDPIVRPLKGTPAFGALREMVAREVTYPQMTDDLRARLNDYYSPTIEALEGLTGQTLEHWYGSTNGDRAP